MDLINDLGNEMALAFFVEKKHRQKIDSKEFLALINSMKSELHRYQSKDAALIDLVEPKRAAFGKSN